MQKYYTIVTDLGTELIAQAAQKGQKVNIVHIAAGDGNGTFYNPTSDMTALKREIWRGAILNYEVDALAKNVIKVSGVIPKDVGSFVLREMALFDDKGNMIAICNAPDLLKAVLEEGALTEAVVYMRIAVTNSEAVNITINGSAVFATQEELEAHKSDENAHQELFDKKVDKTNFTGQKIGEMLETAGWNSDKTLEALQGLETHKSEPNAHQELFDKKVDNTEFTGAKIGEMLTQIGWNSGNDMTEELAQKADKDLSNVIKSDLDNKVTTNDNVSIGSGTLNNITTGKRNTGIGKNALASVTTASENVAIGYQALPLCTTGGQNVAIGMDAAKQLTEGAQNVAIGLQALKQSKTGSWNIAIGASALLNHDTGWNNIAIGTGASQSNTTGEQNTAVGNGALQNNATGSYNTALGNRALTALWGMNNPTNCTALGNSAQVTGDNQVQLGNENVTVYAQTAIQTRSDARDKLDIQDTVLGLDFITKLTPRQFRMNSRELYFEQGQKRDYSKIIGTHKAGKRFHQGFVAQEVKQVLDDMQVDFAGYQDHKINGGEDVLSLGYTEFIAPIVKAIQEQQQLIQQQQQKIEQLEQKIKEVIA